MLKLFLLLATLWFSLTAISGEKVLMKSPFAGTWYSADKDELGKELQGYLDKVKLPDLPDKPVLGIVLPHAGYKFSGQTAAYGMKLIQGKGYKRVIVIGLDHRTGLGNCASVPPYTHYATPFGEVPVDVDAIQKLLKYPAFVKTSRAHATEHSVQIQLPFLKYVLKDFKVVPIVTGNLDAAKTAKIADILKGIVDDETLIIASSDFTHYGRNYRYLPFKENVQENLKKLDMGALEQIKKLNYDDFFRYVRETHDTICGRNNIGILLKMLPKETQPTMLHYTTSGAVTGDFENSVSYFSIAFSGQWPKGLKSPEPPVLELNAQDKTSLLLMARKSILFFMARGKLPKPADIDMKVTPAMKKIMGGFVTLHRNGRLRGCIGEITPRRPLYQVVISRAVSAAFNDNRFPQVQARELDDIDIEISALTPPKEVESYKDIVLGKHGVVLIKGRRSAVYLPQVATEQKWNLDQTLSHLSRKAGLPEDAWKSGARFMVFEAIVFGEKKKE